MLELNKDEWLDDYWPMKWKECGKKEPWSNSRYYSSICLEGLSKNIDSLSHDSRYPSRDLNLRAPEMFYINYDITLNNNNS
jgi:hypothetical protein